ncbi:hypothetical protein ACFRMN_31365 [Streptomyces sp. NPDC056835]|uniref:hypothetical protein n=1 Tax=Streptomyces sp. NPDC056835 TaxID=3345956 RepID=UPI0036A718FC
MSLHVDRAIEEAISRQLGGDGNWSTEQLESLTVLHVSHARELEGLLLCPNLEGLILVGCELTSLRALPLLESLVSLTVEDSSLVDLSGIESFELYTLRVARNFIRELAPLLNQARLKRADLRGNPLSEQAYTVAIPKLLSRGVDITSSAAREWHLTRRLHDSGLPFSFYRATDGYRLSRPGLSLTERPEADHPIVEPDELERLLANSLGAVEDLFDRGDLSWP